MVCKLKCATCKFNSCPGRWPGKTCVVAADEVPNNIVNALSQPVPPKVLNALIEGHTKYHANKASTSAAVFEFNPAIAGDAQPGGVSTEQILEANASYARFDGPRLHTS